MDRAEILKAQSPAALAEEYLIKSIWSHHFPPGTDLPAERDLADIIGVTRTTLREVLQRLARDGWVSIQHGKPTKVNNIWETAGPNIIGTLMSLDASMAPTMIANVVSLRTRIAEFYIPEAIRLNAGASLALFAALDELEDSASSYAAFDYLLYRNFTFVANKPFYALILNSFKELYHQIASLFFSDESARKGTYACYQQLKWACELNDSNIAIEAMAVNRQHSSKIWTEMLKNLPKNFMAVS